MPAKIFLHQIQIEQVSMSGEISVEELDVDLQDEMITSIRPLAYSIDAQLIDNEILITGKLRMDLGCVCVRCLQAFLHPLVIPDWNCLLPITGEDAVEFSGDSIDLVPIIREDVLLAFPQHPLCKSACPGIVYRPPGEGAPKSKDGDPSVWDQLNKLKLD